MPVAVMLLVVLAGSTAFEQSVQESNTTILQEDGIRPLYTRFRSELRTIATSESGVTGTGWDSASQRNPRRTSNVGSRNAPSWRILIAASTIVTAWSASARCSSALRVNGFR